LPVQLVGAGSELVIAVPHRELQGNKLMHGQGCTVYVTAWLIRSSVYFFSKKILKKSVYLEHQIRHF
jgi:hypothetical protein